MLSEQLENTRRELAQSSCNAPDPSNKHCLSIIRGGFLNELFICQTKTDRDSRSRFYCTCNSYSGTLPLLSPTFPPYNPCGYTTVPDPFHIPIQTRQAGDIIGCQSSTSSTTLYSASPPSTSTPTAVPQYTFAMWREFDYSVTDVCICLLKGTPIPIVSHFFTRD